jgi:hypothetical protein
VADLRLHYSKASAIDEYRMGVGARSPGLFEYEGREWIADPVATDGFTLCTEHERIFDVTVDGAAYVYTGPRPESGEIVALDGGGGRVRAGAVASAHHNIWRGSFCAERIDG